MRAAIQGHDSGIVDHLVQNDDGVFALKYLNVAVVIEPPRRQRRPGDEPGNAALGQRTIFRSGRWAETELPVSFLTRLGGFGEWWDLAVVGFVDERRAPVFRERQVGRNPDFHTDVVLAFLRSHETLEAVVRPVEVGRSFFLAEVGFFGKSLRSLQRRRNSELPSPVEIRCTPRGARWFSRRLCRCHRGR